MQNDEPVWLSPEAIIDINVDVVEDTNEPHFLRDRGLLESASARPFQHFAYREERDILILAFVLLEGIAQNHPFEQGNKRTAFLAALLMLRLNGYDLDAPEYGEDLGKLVEELVEGKLGLDDFTEALRPYLVEI